MVDRKTWQEFRDCGLLWWTNRILHTFGWAIVMVLEEDGSISDVYPARVKFRGFHEDSEINGFKKISEHMFKESETLLKEANED